MTITWKELPLVSDEEKIRALAHEAKRTLDQPLDGPEADDIRLTGLEIVVDELLKIVDAPKQGEAHTGTTNERSINAFFRKVVRTFTP